MPEPADPIETIPAELREIHDRLDEGDERMKRLEEGLQENNAATARVDQRTADMVELFEMGRAFFKAVNAVAGFFLRVAETLAKVAKPIGFIAGAVGAVVAAYSAWKSGGPHIGPKP